MALYEALRSFHLPSPPESAKRDKVVKKGQKVQLTKDQAKKLGDKYVKAVPKKKS